MIRKHFEGSPFYPDIIIHRRTLKGIKTNEYNLCIIEMKLSTNTESRVSDANKLEFATVNEADTLSYQLGIFIEFYAGKESRLGHDKIVTNLKKFILYKNGHEI